MKASLVGVIVIVTFGFAVAADTTLLGTTTEAQTLTNTNDASSSQGSFSDPFANYIDGIKIPTDVLLQIQLDFQGSAVTQAEEVTVNGKRLYRLRVDRDTDINDYKSIYLLYNMKWKRVDELKLTKPQVRVVEPAPIIAPEPEPKPAAEEKPAPPEDSTNGDVVQPPQPQPPTPPQEPEPEPGSDTSNEPVTNTTP